MQVTRVYLLISISGWVTACSAWENDRLFYYETMSTISETARAKRSNRLVKELRFQAFKRDFNLQLISGSPVLAKGFQARLVYGNGSSTRFMVGQNMIFTGRVLDAKQSVVSAYREGQLWNINIFEEGEAFAVEPAWRLLSEVDNPHNDTMVSYRLSDVKGLPPNYRFCSETAIFNASKPYRPALGKPHPVEDGHFRPARGKRHAKNTCHIQLVGDANLFRETCGGNAGVCAAMMISHLQYTDMLFRRSVFEEEFDIEHTTGFGLQVGALRLYPFYTERYNAYHHRDFNTRFDFTGPEKLEAFAFYMYEERNDFCLHHLFSHFEDPDGVLGRAYQNVLCGLMGRDLKAYNTGVSSGTNSAGKQIPSLMSNIVVAHEIGHNFGASHDPASPECAPEGTNGGKYIMWQFAVEGNRANNQKFSKCTLRQIGREIPAWCFTERTEQDQFCGDGIIQGHEECDPGFGGRFRSWCCDASCKLRPGAECCDSNYDCCLHCKIAPNDTLCRIPGYVGNCQQNSYCSGDNLHCPEGETKSDGESCGDNFVCFKGKCIDPCEQETIKMNNGTSLQSCSCTGNRTEMCMHCCLDITLGRDSPGECRPLLQQLKEDGSQCEGGICRKGVCDQTPVLTAAILTRYLSQFTKPSQFESVLKANIVVIVLVLSLIMWVPSSLMISYLDRVETRQRHLLHEHETEKQDIEHIGRQYAVEIWLLSHEPHAEVGQVLADESASYKSSNVCELEKVGQALADESASCKSSNVCELKKSSQQPSMNPTPRESTT